MKAFDHRTEKNLFSSIVRTCITLHGTDIDLFLLNFATVTCKFGCIQFTYVLSSSTYSSVCGSVYCAIWPKKQRKEQLRKFAFDFIFKILSDMFYLVLSHFFVCDVALVYVSMFHCANRMPTSRLWMSWSFWSSRWLSFVEGSRMPAQHSPSSAPRLLPACSVPCL